MTDRAISAEDEMKLDKWIDLAPKNTTAIVFFDGGYTVILPTDIGMPGGPSDNICVPIAGCIALLSEKNQDLLE